MLAVNVHFKSFNFLAVLVCPCSNNRNAIHAGFSATIILAGVCLGLHPTLYSTVAPNHNWLEGVFADPMLLFVGLAPGSFATGYLLVQRRADVILRYVPATLSYRICCRTAPLLFFEQRLKSSICARPRAWRIIGVVVAWSQQLCNRAMVLMS